MEILAVKSGLKSSRAGGRLYLKFAFPKAHFVLSKRGQQTRKLICGEGAK